MDQKRRDYLAKPVDWKKFGSVRGEWPVQPAERDKNAMLKKARLELSKMRPQSKGSVGRESAGKQRDRDARVLIRAGVVEQE
jgi:hypothetical protein